MKCIIRPAENKDLDELLVLMEEHARYEKTTFQPFGKKEKLHVALFSRQPRLYCWVVEFGAALQGYATYTIDYSTWDASDFIYLDCLFLRPICRGIGIGTKILSKLKALAIARKCIGIEWQTPTFNKAAIVFYHKNNATSTEKVRFSLKIDTYANDRQSG